MGSKRKSAGKRSAKKEPVGEVEIIDSGGVSRVTVYVDKGGGQETIDVQAGVAFAMSTDRHELIGRCIEDVTRGGYQPGAPSYISLLKVIRDLMIRNENLHREYKDTHAMVRKYRERVKHIKGTLENELDDLDPDLIEEDAFETEDMAAAANGYDNYGSLPDE